VINRQFLINPQNSHRQWMSYIDACRELLIISGVLFPCSYQRDAGQSIDAHWKSKLIFIQNSERMS
jgi:hypothetical protein